MRYFIPFLILLIALNAYAIDVEERDKTTSKVLCDYTNMRGTGLGHEAAIDFGRYPRKTASFPGDRC